MNSLSPSPTGSLRTQPFQGLTFNYIAVTPKALCFAPTFFLSSLLTCSAAYFSVSLHEYLIVFLKWKHFPSPNSYFSHLFLIRNSFIVHTVSHVRQLLFIFYSSFSFIHHAKMGVLSMPPSKISFPLSPTSILAQTCGLFYLHWFL